MNMPTATKIRIPYFITEATVDVEIDPGDLHAGGWHHENECPKGAPLSAGHAFIADAIASLHQQAHPDEPIDPTLCHQEPCRWMTISELRGTP